MKLKLKEVIIFGMLGALMYATKLMLAAFPNVHLVAVFIVATTLVYRAKALFPLYIYILLEGIFTGFGIWWISYLYIWAILWGAVMLLPKDLYKKTKWAIVIYSAVASAHGFLFGTLWAPSQALLFGLNFKSTLAWIAAGLPYDIIHGISNLALGFLIVPAILVLNRLEGKPNK